MSRLWLAERLYGWTHAPNLAAISCPFVYLKCVLHCAEPRVGAELSPQHRAYGQGLAEVAGLGDVDPDLVQFANHFMKGSPHDLVASGESTAKVQHRFSPLLSRMLIYDCMKAASVTSRLLSSSSSGPSATTSASAATGAAAAAPTVIVGDDALTHLAQELSVSTSTVLRLKQLCEREEELNRRKVALLRRSQ